MQISSTHHSIVPTWQGIEGEWAIFFGDRIAQIHETFILGLEAGHWWDVAPQDILCQGGERKMTSFSTHMFWLSSKSHTTGKFLQVLYHKILISEQGLVAEIKRTTTFTLKLEKLKTGTVLLEKNDVIIRSYHGSPSCSQENGAQEGQVAGPRNRQKAKLWSVTPGSDCVLSTTVRSRHRHSISCESTKKRNALKCWDCMSTLTCVSIVLLVSKPPPHPQFHLFFAFLYLPLWKPQMKREETSPLSWAPRHCGQSQTHCSRPLWGDWRRWHWSWLPARWCSPTEEGGFTFPNDKPS